MRVCSFCFLSIDRIYHRMTALLQSGHSVFDSAVFADLSLNQLDELNNGDHNETESDCNQIFADAYACKAECVCKERNLAYEGGCNERTNARKPQGLVLRTELEDTAALRAHIETVENLCHRHCQERHGHAVRTVCDLPIAGFHKVTDKVGGNSEKSYENALISDIHAHTAREDSRLCVTGLAAHDVGLCLFCSERKRREAVGYKIYPQKVNRLKNSKSEQSCREDGKHLAHI